MSLRKGLFVTLGLDQTLYPPGARSLGKRDLKGSLSSLWHPGKPDVMLTSSAVALPCSHVLALASSPQPGG